VVVVDAGPFAEIPDGTAIKLPWGPSFEMDLADTLLRLAITPAARAQIGEAAAREIGRRNSPDVTLAAYRAAIDDAAATDPRPWRSDAIFNFRPPQHSPPAAAPLWQRLDAVPGLMPPAPAPFGPTLIGRVLAQGSRADLAALRSLGHIPQTTAPDWRPQDEPARARDLVFLHLPAGHALLAAPGLLADVNRLLRFGGVLVLVLTGIGPRAHKLAARATGMTALRAAGFRVDLAAAAVPPTLAYDGRPEPDSMVWRASKVSEFAAQPAFDAA